MIRIEEFIHHGDYLSRRVVEVYAINETTVDAILQSSAYCYGTFQTDERQHLLDALIADLKAGKEHRGIGWSTFRLV